MRCVILVTFEPETTSALMRLPNFAYVILVAGLMAIVAPTAHGQTYSHTWISIPSGTFTMGEPESSYLGPPGSWDSPEHTVTVDGFRMSETEITNQQYVDFLNDAEWAGLIEVREETNPGPDLGATLVYGTASAPEIYSGIAIVNLSGTRVMKDHLDDGDGDPFTGVIQPENPLNISYIGYDASRDLLERFYVKDPRDASDFDWNALTDYYNYTSTSRELDTSVLLNDFADWPELSDYPNNLPTVDDVKNWPASFIRWYGAKAYAVYSGNDLPTEAEWEWAAQGGAAFTYATDDGTVNGDGTSANWNYAHNEPSTWHVEDVKRGSPNPYGLYNMAGNVWEWVEDWYDAAFYADATNPVNTTDSGRKVRRGGSWNYHESTLKTAARAADEQFKGNDHFGFRVVSRPSQGTANESSDLPQSMELIQNYPNPFNTTTDVRFSLASAGNVQLEVFDLMGRSVDVLEHGFLPVGSHTRVFDGTALPSGIYYVRLQTHDGIVTRSLVLHR